MKYPGFTFLLAFLFFTQFAVAQAKNQAKRDDYAYAKLQLQEALTNNLQKQILVDTVIGDEKTATRVAEAILFKIYGKDEIVAEKPYKINYIKGYWILEGTLPTEWLGGVFLIIMRAKDGQVVKLTHGK